MQITGLSQCLSRQKGAGIELKRGDIDVTFTITTSYETCSKFAYLRPTLLLDDFMRVMRGSL